VPLLPNVQPKAIVATTARPATSLVAEISKDKGPAATGRVRVFLHGVELCELGSTPPIGRSPIELKR
jgi:hypothetical protein